MYRILGVLLTAGLGYSLAATDISGFLVGHDGGPMAGAKVMLFERPYSKAVAVAAATVDEDGRFKLAQLSQ